MRLVDHPVPFAELVLRTTLHGGQAAFLADRHVVRVLIGGRRAGKSTAVALLVAWSVARAVLLGEPFRALLTAPSIDQARLLFESVLRLLRESALRDIVTRHVDSPFPLAEAGERVSIAVRSLAEHGKHLRGHGAFDLLIVDEAGFVAEHILQEAVAPLIADRPGAVLVLSSTPTNIGGLLHRNFERGRDGSDPRVRSFHFRSEDNPALDVEYLDAQRADLSEAQWRTEWVGEFAAAQNAFFRWADISACAQIEGGEPVGRRHLIGYDPAKLRDGSGVIVIDDSVMPRRVVHVEDLGGRDYDEQIQHIAGLSKRFGSARVVVDATGGGLVVSDLLRAAGIQVTSVVWTAARKAAQLTALAAAIERRELLLPANADLMRELRWFQATRGPTGVIRYEAGPGARDDLVCALALALSGCGGVVRRQTLASFGVPFLRSGDHFAVTPDGRPRITRQFVGEFPEDTWRDVGR